jgi:GTPase
MTSTPERPGSSANRVRVAIVRVTTNATRHVDPDAALEELAGLAEAAGAEVAATVTQDRPTPDPATLLGHGKVEELARTVEALEIDLVVVDNELSPGQTRNLEKVIARRVIDRTALILDIFALRARTREGQLQVELAQLKYLLPRLAGSSEALSRLGGGIGTRGPGETKLETDRRRLRARISALESEIAVVRRRRGYLRARRRRIDAPTIALVGYTNAGKTTLFNRLTGATALANDALFVTLDPVMRRLRLPDARQIVLADTVGFIDRLPHQLVAAFHATLEEVAAADLLLHVIDASAPDRDRREEAVRTVLAEVGAAKVPMIDVMNKADRLQESARAAIVAGRPEAAIVSARDGEGIDVLIARMAKMLDMDGERVHMSLDASQESDRRLIADLYRHARVLRHEDVDGQVEIEADVPRRLLSRFGAVAVTR